MTMRSLLLPLVFALSACGGGAAKYLKLESRLIESNRDGEREITGSPMYENTYRNVIKVAVRAPDVCANQNASEATGAARQDAAVATLIKTSCGVEMAEMERSLTKRGYQVVSWKMLSNIVAADAKIPVLDAAKKLGAQVLFQVNSLERVNIVPGQDARIERRFFNSNKFGETLAPATLAEGSIDSMRPLLLKQEDDLRRFGRLGAMLDVNATIVESGQSIWFYRASKIEQLTRDATASILLTQKKKQGWTVTSPQQQGQAGEDTRVARSAEMVAVSSGGRSADQENAAYFALVRNAVDDFANSFASGQSSAMPPMVAPPPGARIPPPPPPMPRP